MKGKKHTEEQIIGILREGEAAGSPKEVCRKYGIAENTFYRWKAKFGGMELSDARKLKALEEENRKLKRIVADQAIDIVALKDIVSRKW